MNSDELIPKLREEVAEKIDMTETVSDKQLRAIIEKCVFEQAKRNFWNAQEIERIVQRLYHSFRGLDVLQPLVEDPEISEIMVNSYEEVFIEKQGEISRHPYGFESEEKLENIIQMIVAGVNRVVNESSPIVDARLPNGSRVNVVLPPISLKGPTMTIRKFPERPLGMADLIQSETISKEAADVLETLVKAKYNLFISGGTGSGKTTFLNILSNYIPRGERIITIEDSAELQIRNLPNIVRLETRNENVEGRGEVSIRDLIRSSLRMRPDRIIVGEVRGEEALDMLQAMNTGHEGSLSTGHANSAKDMISRLETMVFSAADLPIGVIRKQISSAIDVIVHLSRMRDRNRKVLEICEVLGMEDGEIQLRPLYEFLERDDSDEQTVKGDLHQTDYPLQNQLKLKMAGIDLQSSRERSEQP